MLMFFNKQALFTDNNPFKLSLQIYADCQSGNKYSKRWFEFWF